MYATWDDVDRDFESPEFSRIRHVKSARKDCQCDHCGQKIAAGTSYYYITYKMEGVFSVMKTHSVNADCLTWDIGH
jgi:hypothetical protein